MIWQKEERRDRQSEGGHSCSYKQTPTHKVPPATHRRSYALCVDIAPLFCVSFPSGSNSEKMPLCSWLLVLSLAALTGKMFFFSSPLWSLWSSLSCVIPENMFCAVTTSQTERNCSASPPVSGQEIYDHTNVLMLEHVNSYSCMQVKVNDYCRRDTEGDGSALL